MWNKTLNALKVIIIHPWLQIAFSCTYDGGHFSKGPCYNSIAKLGAQYIVSLSNWWALWNLTMLIHLLLSGDFREASLSKFLLLWMGNGLRTEPVVWVIHIEDFFNVLFEFWEFSGQVQCPNGMVVMTRHSFSLFLYPFWQATILNFLHLIEAILRLMWMAGNDFLAHFCGENNCFSLLQYPVKFIRAQKVGHWSM